MFAGSTALVARPAVAIKEAVVILSKTTIRTPRDNLSQADRSIFR